MGERTWADDGTFGYYAPGDRMWFRSSVSGETFDARPGAPGALLVEQAIGSAPLLTWEWVVR